MKKMFKTAARFLHYRRLCKILKKGGRVYIPDSETKAFRMFCRNMYDVSVLFFSNSKCPEGHSRALFM